MDRKSIVLSVPSHPLVRNGGAQYQAHLIAREMAKLHDVTYLTVNGPKNKSYHNYSIRNTGTYGLLSKYTYLLDCFLLFIKLWKIRPDVVYSRVGVSLVGAAAFYCKIFGKRHIWHVAHEYDTELGGSQFNKRLFWKPIERWILKYGQLNSDTIVVQTEQQKQWVNQKLNRDAVVFRNVIDACTQSLSKNADSIDVLWVANVKRVKQPQVLLEIASKFKDNPKVQFFMIGRTEGDYGKNIVAKASRLKNVHFLGQLSQTEVLEKMAASHILINTSLAEGFSNTFIQSWQRGMPVISLNSDPDNVIKNNKIGYQNSNISDLANYLEWLVDNPQQIINIGDRAIRYVNQNHELQNEPLRSKLEGFFN